LAPACLPGTWTGISVVSFSDMAVCGNKCVVAGQTALSVAVSYNVITDTADRPTLVPLLLATLSRSRRVLSG
jgi:hypothetical protein